MTELELGEFLPQLQEFLAELTAVPEPAGGDESGDDVEVIDEVKPDNSNNNNNNNDDNDNDE